MTKTSEWECPICRDGTIDEEHSQKTLVLCKHTFHTTCVYSWWTKKTICPLCNGKVNETDLSDISHSNKHEAMLYTGGLWWWMYYGCLVVHYLYILRYFGLFPALALVGVDLSHSFFVRRIKDEHRRKYPYLMWGFEYVIPYVFSFMLGTDFIRKGRNLQNYSAVTFFVGLRLVLHLLRIFLRKIKHKIYQNSMELKIYTAFQHHKRYPTERASATPSSIQKILGAIPVGVITIGVLMNSYFTNTMEGIA
jgi:hypothetical protein